MITSITISFTYNPQQWAEIGSVLNQAADDEFDCVEPDRDGYELLLGFDKKIDLALNESKAGPQ